MDDGFMRFPWVLRCSASLVERMVRGSGADVAQQQRQMIEALERSSSMNPTVAQPERLLRLVVSGVGGLGRLPSDEVVVVDLQSLGRAFSTSNTH